MRSRVNLRKIFLYMCCSTIDYFIALFAYIPMAGLVITFKVTLPLLGYLEVLGLVSSILTSSSHPSSLRQPWRIPWKFLFTVFWLVFPCPDCSSHHLQPDSCGQVQKIFSSNDLFASFYLDHGHVWDDYSLLEGGARKQKVTQTLDKVTVGDGPG